MGMVLQSCMHTANLMLSRHMSLSGSCRASSEFHVLYWHCAIADQYYPALPVQENYLQNDLILMVPAAKESGFDNLHPPEMHLNPQSGSAGTWKGSWFVTTYSPCSISTREWLLVKSLLLQNISLRILLTHCFSVCSPNGTMTGAALCVALISFYGVATRDPFTVAVLTLHGLLI